MFPLATQETAECVPSGALCRTLPYKFLFFCALVLWCNYRLLPGDGVLRPRDEHSMKTDRFLKHNKKLANKVLVLLLASDTPPFLVYC